MLLRDHSQVSELSEFYQFTEYLDENTFDEEDAEMLKKADQEWEAMNMMEETPWDPNYPDIEQTHYP